MPRSRARARGAPRGARSRRRRAPRDDHPARRQHRPAHRAARGDRRRAARAGGLPHPAQARLRLGVRQGRLHAPVPRARARHPAHRGGSTRRGRPHRPERDSLPRRGEARRLRRLLPHADEGLQEGLLRDRAVRARRAVARPARLGLRRRLPRPGARRRGRHLHGLAHALHRRRREGAAARRGAGAARGPRPRHARQPGRHGHPREARAVGARRRTARGRGLPRLCQLRRQARPQDRSRALPRLQPAHRAQLLLQRRRGREPDGGARPRRHRRRDGRGPRGGGRGPLHARPRLAASALRARRGAARRRGRVFDPQRYDRDRGLRRLIDVELTEKNHIRKFAQYYPKPTDTSF